MASLLQTALLAGRPALQRAVFVGTQATTAACNDISGALLDRRQSSSQAGPKDASSPPQFAQSPMDAFTAGLQNKTEQELMQLIQQARDQKLQGGDGEEDAPEEEEQVVNPETGELYGPRGKEPTRFGDWENKGKCIDF